MDSRNIRMLLADAIRQKIARRRRFAEATFSEKIIIAEKLREELLPLKVAKFVRPVEVTADVHPDLK